VAENPVAALSDPVIQDWLGRRYRNIFLTEAANDRNALRVAVNKVPLPMQFIDRRSTKELLASRFLKGSAREESHVEMPVAAEPHLDFTTLLFVPGMMTGLLPVTAFQSVWPRLEDRFGVKILTADVHPARSSHDNGEDIQAALDRGRGIDADSLQIPRKRATKPGDVVILGYAKGATDAMVFFAEHPEYASRVRAFIGWAGIFGGSYIADDVAERLPEGPSPTEPLSGQIGKLLRQIVPVVQVDRVSSRLAEYDVAAAVADMTTIKREEFLRDNLGTISALGIPSFTFAGVTSVREVPYYQALGVLQLKNYDKNNDMLLTSSQTKLPVSHSTQLATFRAHHWDLAYDPFPWFTRMGSLNVDHKFARYPALAALIIFLSELGLMD